MEDVLNADDHKDVVSSVLSHLTREEIISLGKALGLKKETMQPMSKMPGDMVEAWLKMKDDVYDEHGEPTWNSLVKGLKKVNQKSLASKIIEAKGAPPNLTKRQPSGNDHVDAGEEKVKGDEAATGGERTESDFNLLNLFKKKQTHPESKVDTEKKLLTTYTRQGSTTHDSSANKLGSAVTDHFRAMTGDQDLSWKQLVEIRKPTSDRGKYKAQLRLQDSEEDITEIPPVESDKRPYSHRGFYPMNSARHGVALIINNKEFQSTSHKSRRGTDRDEQNLTETWQYLGYHVIIQRNCTRDKLACTFRDIDKLLIEAQNSQNVANDSFVCCILSHGKEGEVFGSDSRPLEYTRMQRYLGASKILRSKPKVLVIQACQGSRQGSKAIEDYLPDVGADGGMISEYSDFYLCCASVDGDRSYRDIFTGTWFITELCCSLCKFSKVMDLDEIQKDVNERVVKKYQFREFKQQPRGIDQLRRKVFFFDQKDISEP